MNYFIVNATTREIWEEWSPPKYTGKPNNEDDIADYLKRLRDYDTNFITRPHYPYSPELNWREGQRVEDGKDFELKKEWVMTGRKDEYDGSMDKYQKTIAIPLPSKEKQGIAETLRQLREIGTAWDNIICVCRGLIKDNPCEINCKEFHDEYLPNEFSKRDAK